jgi:hypothetical protein
MNAFGRPVAFLSTDERVSWSSIHNSCRYLLVLLPKTKAFIPKPEHLATLFYESRQPWGTGHPPPKPWPRYGHSRHMQRKIIQGPRAVVARGSGATLWVVASAIGSSLENLRPSQPSSSVGTRWGHGQYPEDANRKCSFLTACLPRSPAGSSGNSCPVARLAGLNPANRSLKQPDCLSILPDCRIRPSQSGLLLFRIIGAVSSPGTFDKRRTDCSLVRVSYQFPGSLHG